MNPSIPTDPHEPFIPMPREHWLALWKEQARAYAEAHPPQGMGGAMGSLPPQYIRDIRRLCAAGARKTEVARIYGISERMVYHIVSREYYAWVTDEVAA